MKKVLFGAIMTLAAVLIYKSFTDSNSRKTQVVERSALIQQEIKKVSKLVVTEGHFSEVFSYADSKELFGPLLTADKKALVVVNAEVSIVYDLAQLEILVDEENQQLLLGTIPEPEIKINPDLEYYDVTSDFFNPFEAADYNAIKKQVNSSLSEKVAASSLYANAENRLVSELSKLLLLTRSVGWSLVYNEEPISQESGLYRIKE